jgi:23S rRNA (cytidine1920-2'-O)/16S rRNA (cytidine1409-2'-O)-methyltransferase
LESVPVALWFDHKTWSVMARKQRLDLELVARGLAVSRQQAQQLIRAGRVRQGDRVLDKPGTEVLPEAELLVQQPPRYVSRGGEKLVRALEAFPIAVQGRVCLDGGISTGGFSDCLLQHGACRIYGIDVGYGQTAWSLRSDPRVVLKERTNLRHLTPDALYGPEDPLPDLAVADVSFIALGLVLPALLGLLQPQAPVDLILLVKPQFEVGKGRVGKGGVVRDPVAHCDAIEGVITAAAGLGLAACGLVASPITGPAGNHEYLLWLRRPDRDGRYGMGDVAGVVFEAVEQDPNHAKFSSAPPALGQFPAPISPDQIKTLVVSTLTPRA